MNCFVSLVRMPDIEVMTNSEKEKMASTKKYIEEHHTAVILRTKERYQDVLAELYFLQNGGNMMDFTVWRKKPPASFLDYVKSQPLELNGVVSVIEEIASACNTSGTCFVCVNLFCCFV